MSTQQQARAVGANGVKSVKQVVPPLVRIETHYRKFISSRWNGLVIRAGIVTSLAFFALPGLLISWNYSILTALGTLFLAGPFIFIFGLNPLLWSRRVWYSSPTQFQSTPSSPAVIFQTFNNVRVVAVLINQALYALVIALVFAFSLNWRNPTAALGWFNSTARYPWHGNERLWFLVHGNTLFFIGLGLRDVLGGRLSPKWPKWPNTRTIRFPDAVRKSLVACFSGYQDDRTFVHDASLAFTWTTVYTTVYLLLRKWAWRAAVTNIPLIRPFIYNYASRNTVSVLLGWYLFVLQLTALLAMKPVLAVLNDYLTQPLNFGSFTSRSPLSPERYVLTALQTKNQLYLNHTLIELQRLVHSLSHRDTIFAETTRPALVHQIFQALLVQLGKDFQVLVSRGSSVKAVKGNKAEVVPVPDSHSIAVKSGADIFRPLPKRTGIQALVGDVLAGAPRPTPAPVVAAANNIKVAEVKVAKRVDDEVHAAQRWAAGTPFLGPVVAAVKLASGGLSRWVGEEWASRAVGAAVPELDRLERIVDILTTLSVASADEDKYGYVQQVLPATLEAFVRFRWAVDALQADLLSKAPLVSANAATDVHGDTTLVANILNQGIIRIAERFDNTLQAFRFPSSIALSLTEICKGV